jgi:hypothetical protein
VPEAPLRTNSGLPVPLFYFHLIATRVTLLDEDGMRLADREQALAYARVLMSELALNRQTKDGIIVVENDDDGELFEVAPCGPSLRRC